VRRPIFLHTGWRTAGTWLWTRLREDPGVLGFYEPLNEGLGSIGHADIARFRTDSWASHHPYQGRSYYEEFAPFVRRWQRGVAGYDEHFALDGWFSGARGGHADLRAYLTMLVAHAEARHRVAVCKFTRSLGRLPWITHAFPDASHIVVVRNPLDQWCSAWEQATRHDNPYFLIMPWLALHRNLSCTALATSAALLEIAPIDFGAGRLQRQYDRARALIAHIPPEASYRAFLAIWLLGVLDALRYGDIVVDIDALHHDDAYRPHGERNIAKHTGIDVDFRTFDPARRSAHHGITQLLDLDGVHHDARRAIAALCRSSERTQRVAQRCIQILDRTARPGAAHALLG
jgi:hypothetical protein